MLLNQETLPPKAVLMTGGAKRLGREMALAFAQAGYDIALHYRHSANEATQLQQEIETSGRVCVLLQADLEVSAQCVPLIEQAFAALPHLNVLVNNASLFPKATLTETDAALLEKMMQIHLHAPFLLTQAFARHCPQARIVMMGDTHILNTNPGHFAYLLSKKALMDATRMLARSLAPLARVNAICPGAIIAENGDAPDALDRYGSKLPLAATATPQQICELALFLAAQGPLTGQFLFADGGEHLL